MQEFPKCLYRDGDIEGEYRLVWSADEEASVRDDGFASAGEKHEADKPRRGRPPKVKE